MTQDRPKVHPKWILITLLSRWGWKNAPTLLRRQFFHGIYSVFCTSHIPKAACNIAPKIQKLSSHAGKTRSFYANASPQTCARSNFSCNLQCFFPHFQHRFWPPKVYKSPCPPHPPMATAEKTSQRFQRFLSSSQSSPFFQNPIWAMWKTCKISRIWVLKTSTIPKWSWAVYGDTIGFTLWSPSGSKFWNTWN